MRAIPLGLVIINALNGSLPDLNSCLSNFFYGSYGDHAIFSPGATCIHPHPTVSYWPREENRLVWVQKQAIEESLKNPLDGDLDDMLTRFTQLTPSTSQDVLSQSQSTYVVLHRTHASALLSVPLHAVHILPDHLPRFYRSMPLPINPLPYPPVSNPALERVKRLLAQLRFNPNVAALASNISIAQMRNDIRYLTGEDSRSPINSRHSFAEGSRVAAQWLKERFEETGAYCQLRSFLPGYAPNVICEYPGTSDPSSTVLISAHYDSRGSFGSTRAPGANDDGSGVVGLLAIARTIRRRRVRFKSRVELCAFAGEEQGLFGSRARAAEMRAANANLTLMVQADMTGYRAPGEPSQLGLPERIGTPEVSQLVANVSAMYSPELTVGWTKTCCSDHQSFFEQGFPATELFERAGPIADPMYHNSADLSEREGYELVQIKSIAKVQFATLLHAAGFDLDEDDVY